MQRERLRSLKGSAFPPLSFRTEEETMDKIFVSGTRPYSEDERERDRAAAQRATSLQVVRRKATPSGQRYNTQITQANRRATNRMVGSE